MSPEKSHRELNNNWPKLYHQVDRELEPRLRAGFAKEAQQ